MSRKRNKKAKQPKLQGTKIDLMVIDEADSLAPGVWASEKPSYSPEPVEEPIEGLVYAQGGILAKNPTGLFNLDGIHGSFAGLASSVGKAADSFQKIGRAMRNVGPITVMVDSEMTVSQETLEMILGPQKKQEPLEPTTLAKTISPKLNNLCEEVELPKRALSVEEHREFIREMMLTSLKADVKSLYYQKPSSIPEVKVELEGRKPHIQQFVDIVRKTNGKA